MYHFREYQNHHKPIVGRNRHIKSAVGEGSEGSEEHVIRDWSTEDPCYIQKQKVELNCFLHLCAKQNLLTINLDS